MFISNNNIISNYMNVYSARGEKGEPGAVGQKGVPGK